MDGTSLLKGESSVGLATSSRSGLCPEAGHINKASKDNNNPGSSWNKSTDEGGQSGRLTAATLGKTVARLQKQLLQERQAQVRAEIEENQAFKQAALERLFALTQVEPRPDLAFKKGQARGTGASGSQEGGVKEKAPRLKPIRMPAVRLVPRYTTWVHVSRNWRMTEDQSVVGRRRLYYDAEKDETTVCSESDEEYETEEDRHEFTPHEDQILLNVVEEHGMSPLVMSELANVFKAKHGEIKARFAELQEEKSSHAGMNQTQPRPSMPPFTPVPSANDGMAPGRALFTQDAVPATRCPGRAEVTTNETVPRVSSAARKDAPPQPVGAEAGASGVKQSESAVGLAAPMEATNEKGRATVKRMRASAGESLPVPMQAGAGGGGGVGGSKTQALEGGTDEARQPESLPEDLETAMDTFDNLFCRRCLIFDCRLHGAVQAPEPCERQPPVNLPQTGRPCGPHCHLSSTNPRQPGGAMDDTTARKPPSYLSVKPTVLLAEKQRQGDGKGTEKPGMGRGGGRPLRGVSLAGEDPEAGRDSKKRKAAEGGSRGRTGGCSVAAGSACEEEENREDDGQSPPPRRKVRHHGGRFWKMAGKRRRSTRLAEEEKEEEKEEEEEEEGLEEDAGRDKEREWVESQGEGEGEGNGEGIACIERRKRLRGNLEGNVADGGADGEGDESEEEGEGEWGEREEDDASEGRGEGGGSKEGQGDNRVRPLPAARSKEGRESTKQHCADAAQENDTWTKLERQLYEKGLEMFGPDSCRIARNLLLRMRTCAEVSERMTADAARRSGKAGSASTWEWNDESAGTTVQRRPRRRGKFALGKLGRGRFRALQPAVLLGSRKDKIGNETRRQYAPCECKGACTRASCPCIINGTVCEKYCGCSRACKQRFRGCQCGKGQCRSRQCPCFAADRECDPDLCRNCWQGCGDGTLGGPPPRADNYECRNMKVLLRQHQRVLLGKSDVQGWGAFIKNSVGKNEYLGEYTGELISHEEADRRGKIYDRVNSSFLFDLNDQYVLDACRKGDKLKFANHSPNPNCYAKVTMVAGDHRVGIFSKEKIAAGQELFYDYGYTADQAPTWWESVAEGGPTSTSRRNHKAA